VYWESAKSGNLFNVWGQRDRAKVYKLAGDKLSETPEVMRDVPNEGHPGAMLSLSANGNNDGIVDLFRRLQWVGLIFYPIYVALCIGLSLLSFHFFETPIRLWLAERFQTRRDSEASAHVNAKAQLL
jgi:hypothetical protein